jgi:hypothetical protein
VAMIVSASRLAELAPVESAPFRLAQPEGIAPERS